MIKGTRLKRDKTIFIPPEESVYMTKQDGKISGRGDFHPAFMKKIMRYIFAQLVHKVCIVQ